jgi:hypothetical protein
MHVQFAILLLAVATARPAPVNTVDSTRGKESSRSLSSFLPFAGDFCFGRTYHIGDISGGGWVGWRSADGSMFLFEGAFPPCPSYRKPVFEDENYRYTAVFGVPTGAAQEWYLGDGLAVVIESSFLPVRSRLAVHWYVSEGITLLTELDPFNGGWGFGWGIRF